MVEKRRYTNRNLFLLLLIIIIFILPAFVFSVEIAKEFKFDKGSSLKEWKEKIFRGKVLYVIEDSEAKSDGQSFLSAQSNETCSGLFYEVKFHPSTKPMISWKWKVAEFPKRKEGAVKDSDWIEQDDFAARFYVIFPKFPFTRTKSLEYVWDETLPEGTIMQSPFFKNIRLFVIRSGKESLGKWVFEERNVYEDYKLAFGKAPESRVGAIALMTDSDNTLSTAEAYYDDIKVGYEKNE
ncbi:MAG: DUF3047 domain-containing protein [Candidatus Omnitrophota bacterium]